MSFPRRSLSENEVISRFIIIPAKAGIQNALEVDSSSFQRKLESRTILKMKEILDSNFRWNDEARSTFFILGQTAKRE